MIRTNKTYEHTMNFVLSNEIKKLKILDNKDALISYMTWSNITSLNV